MQELSDEHDRCASEGEVHQAVADERNYWRTWSEREITRLEGERDEMKRERDEMKKEKNHWKAAVLNRDDGDQCHSRPRSSGWQDNDSHSSGWQDNDPHSSGWQDYNPPSSGLSAPGSRISYEERWQAGAEFRHVLLHGGIIYMRLELFIPMKLTPRPTLTHRRAPANANLSGMPRSALCADLGSNFIPTDGEPFSLILPIQSALCNNFSAL